jgi:hypothetical protein
MWCCVRVIGSGGAVLLYVLRPCVIVGSKTRTQYNVEAENRRAPCRELKRLSMYVENQ